MKRFSVLLSLGAFLLGMLAVMLITTPAKAAVIYSNFGSGDSYGSTSVTVFSAGVAHSYEVGSATSPFFLDSIDLAVNSTGLGGSGVSVHFAANKSGGNEPGDILETSSVYVFQGTSVATATFSGASLIGSPGTYWIWLVLNAGDWARWYLNNTSALSDRASRTSSSDPWTVTQSVEQGAFRVQGTVVPLPGAVWLLGLGLIGIVGVRRKIKK